MSILKRMSEQPSKFQTLMERYRASKNNPVASQQMLAGRFEPKFEQLIMNRKSPELGKIMGDADPLAGDENRLLREYYSMSKRGS